MVLARLRCPAQQGWLGLLRWLVLAPVWFDAAATVPHKEVAMSELELMSTQLELSFDPEPVSESELAAA